MPEVFNQYDGSLKREFSFVRTTALLSRFRDDVAANLDNYGHKTENC